MNTGILENFKLLYYWKTGILENSNILIIPQEILEYWNIGNLENFNTPIVPGKILGILECWIPGKFQCGIAILKNTNRILEYWNP